MPTTLTYNAINSSGKVTGDVANHTLRVIADDGAAVAVSGTPAETDNPGTYQITLTDAENSGSMMTLTGVSATSGVLIPDVRWQNQRARGAFPVVVTVEDDEGNPLENATVRMAAGTDAGDGTTDADGEVTIPRDAASYQVTATLRGYEMTDNGEAVGALTHVVSSDSETHELTIVMAPVVITPSADPDLTTVYGTTYDAQGNVAPSKTVTFRLVRTLVPSRGRIILQGNVAATSDADGALAVELLRNAEYSYSSAGGTKLFKTGGGDSFELPELIVVT